MLQTVAWHDRTQSDHQHQIDTFGAQGYRSLSLSVYNTVGDPRYACVMIKRPQIVSEHMFVGLNAAQFQQKLEDMKAQNFGPQIVTATGPASAAIFGASFIHASRDPLTRTNMTAQQFADQNKDATVTGWKLVWFDCYGSPWDERYVAAWWDNSEMLAWNCDGIGETPSLMQQRVDAVTKTWARLAQLVVTPSGHATSLFYDGTVGTTASRFGMTSAEYQTFFTEQTGKGLSPLRVCATGELNGIRFGAVFGQQEKTPPRVFTAAGPTTNTAVDDVMRTFLQANNIRSASVALVAGTRLVYTQGYTWAQPGFPSVQPTTVFRQASCSKIFVAYSIYRLMQQKRDALPASQQKPFSTMLAGITLQSVLNLHAFGGTPVPDPKFAKITLLDLLTSTSGLNQGFIYSAVEAATAAGHSLPASRMMLAEYVASQLFSATPGDPNNVNYGNLDYFLLAEVVRALSGATTFEEAVQTLVCKPLQMRHVHGSRSLLEDQAADEARYAITQPPPKNEGAGELTAAPSVRTNDRPLVPYQYGCIDMELMSGCGGLSVAVVDMARLVASLSVRTGTPALNADTIDQWMSNAAMASSTLNGPSPHGYHGWDSVSNISYGATNGFSGKKGGSLPGTGTVVAFNTGGMSYIGFFADQGRPGVTVDWLKPLTQIARPEEWKTIDLFPTFDMPSLSPNPKTRSSIPIHAEDQDRSLQSSFDPTAAFQSFSEVTQK